MHDLGLIYAVAVAYGFSMLLSGAAVQGLIKELLPEESLAGLFGDLDGRWRSLCRGTDIFGGGVISSAGVSSTRLRGTVRSISPFFIGKYEGPSFGIRYDAARYAALKAQYNRLYQDDVSPTNGLTFQVAFTF